MSKKKPNKKNRKSKPNRQGLSYEKMHLIFNDLAFLIRKGCCEACLRCKGKGIKRTSLHHTVYAYTKETVRKNKFLALENTIELCFGCHPIADGLRGILLSNPRGGLRSIPRIIQVVKLLPPEQQKHFTKLCRTWLKIKK